MKKAAEAALIVSSIVVFLENGEPAIAVSRILLATRCRLLRHFDQINEF